MKKKNSL